MRNALACVGKKDRPIVTAALRTAFDQDTLAASKEHWAKLIEAFQPRHDKLAELMLRAEDDVLAYKTFPQAHWRQIHSTNPLERLNKEIKRRTNVVGIFPNEPAIRRLIGALMLEQNDEWAVTRRYMTLETVAAICEDQAMDPAKIHHAGRRQGRRRGGKVKTTEYLYYASFAVALCEGPITGIGRIWADGKPMDLSGVTWRWYPGDEAQTADPFIAAKMGAANTPAYRGTAYVVFEELALSTYGNRLPQLSFEVFRPLADPDTAEGLTRAVTMIPASGEFTYATQAIRKTDGGATRPENLNALADATDMVVALDRLQAMAPGGRERQPRRGVVRRRPARGLLQGAAGRRGVGQVDHARQLVGERRQPRQRLPRQPRRSGSPGLWRHAVRLRRGAGDPGDEGARAARHLLSRSS